MPEDTSFFWQSYGFVGNCLSLWRTGGAGYTTKVAEAAMYSKEETLHQLSLRREQDKFWIASQVIEAATMMVDHQDLAKANVKSL